MAMAARPHTPVQDAYSIPHPNETGTLSRGYSTIRSSSRPNSYAGTGSAYYNHPEQTSHLAHNPRFKEDFETASRRSSVQQDGPSGANPGMQRSASLMSPGSSRSGTLRKKASLSKKGSLRRNGSRRSMRAGSVRSLSLGDREKYHSEGVDDVNSAFMVPIPTTGNPTEVLANRFQGMVYLQ